MTRNKMFSVTAADCEWQVKRGSGDGGQKRQKTSSGVQCFHKPSGAMGEATDSRLQSQNRKKAFERMAASDEFQSWLKLKIDAGLDRVDITEATPQGNVITRKLRLEEV